jgi:DHA1 family bicyclomycin/chloramphenicol resistance-like MFS transporter
LPKIPSPARDAPAAGLSRRIAAWFTAFGVLSLSFEPVRVLLPVYVVIEVGGDAGLTAALLGVSVFWTAVGSVVGGVVADAIGHRRSYLIGLSARVILAATFLTTSVPALFVVLSIFGLGWGWSDTGFQGYVIQAFPRNRTATIMGFWFTSMGIAAILGSAIATALVEGPGFVPIGIVGLVASVTGYVLIWLTVPELPEAAAVSSAGPRGNALKLELRRLLRERGVLAFLGLTGFPTVLHGASSVAVPLLLFAASGSPALVASFGLASALPGLVLQPLLGRFADLKGVWAPVTAGAIVVVVAAVAIALAPHFLAVVFVAGVVGHLGVSIKDTLTPTIAREVTAPTIHGRVIGLGSMSWSIGSMLGVLAAGSLLDDHPALLFWLVAGATAGALPLVRRLRTHARLITATPTHSPTPPNLT